MNAKITSAKIQGSYLKKALKQQIMTNEIEHWYVRHNHFIVLYHI